MHEYRMRAACWLGLQVVFFPVFILMIWMHHGLFTVLPDRAGIQVPNWLRDWTGILVPASVYLAASYALARWLNRRYPNSPARKIGDPGQIH